jgi:uncharacterized protein (DUF362 family)
MSGVAIIIFSLMLLVIFDIVRTRENERWRFGPHTTLAQSQAWRPLIDGLREPPPDQRPQLQVDGLPILREGTITLGVGHPVVTVVTSADPDLPKPALLDAALTYEQVDAMVRKALDLDRSGRSIREVIEPDGWVVIKVNSVTNRGNTRSSYYFGGVEHPGQITDLRVVKSVIVYLIEKVGPKRITIAEGGSQSPRVGTPDAPSGMTEDNWSVTYPEFDNLSYFKIIEEVKALGVATVVDTTDLNDAPYRRDPIPGGAIQRLGIQRYEYDGAQYGFHVEGTGSFRRDGFYMPTSILDCDKVIGIPVMKTTIFGETTVIKNYVGTLSSRPYGDGRSKVEHAKGNPEHGYVDLFSYNPPVYAIVEGFYGTEGNGPQSGLNVQHNVVVAGSDPLATEAVTAFIMGFNPLDLVVLFVSS